MPSTTDTTRATPRVRQLAQRLGVPLASITGTGAGGRITPDDVRAVAPRAPDDSWFPQHPVPGAAASATATHVSTGDSDDDWFPGVPSAAQTRAASPEMRPTDTPPGSRRA